MYTTLDNFNDIITIIILYYYNYYETMFLFSMYSTTKTVYFVYDIRVYY